MRIDSNHSAINAYGRTSIGGGSNRLAVDFSALKHERLAEVMCKGSKLDKTKKDDDNEDMFEKIWGPNGMIAVARERFAAMRKDKEDIPEQQAPDVTAANPEPEETPAADYAGLSEKLEEADKIITRVGEGLAEKSGDSGANSHENNAV
jgi:hypothetical protein